MSDEGSASPVSEGTVIAGKYRVSRTLGVGGMGVVVAATHIDLKQRVALKFLLPQAAAHPDLVERFAREARAAAQIQSEHVARVMDVGTLETGAPYMVMEYLEGSDLHHVLKEGPLPIQTAVAYVIHACEAIAEAHALGIVHRDLKPANLYLAKRPNGQSVIKVLDFGISKSTLPSDEAELTHGSAMIGSPSYMAPEQIKAARSVDARADQWSIGVILYELVTGKKPFEGSGAIAELVWVILDQPHAPVSSLRPDVPPGLAAAIDRALAKDPAHRFANIAELAQAIAPYGPAWSEGSAARSAHVLGVGVAPPPGHAFEEVSSVAARPAILAQMSIAAASPSPTPSADPSVTNAPWSNSSAGGVLPKVVPPEPKRSFLVPVIIGTGCAGALVGGFLMLQPSDPAASTAGTATVFVDPAPSVASAPTAPAAPQPAPPPAASTNVASNASPEVAPAGPPPAALAVPAPLPTAAPAASPDPVAPHEGTHAHVKAAPTASAAKAAPKCTTVSYFDADGMKHFKQECK